MSLVLPANPQQSSFSIHSLSEDGPQAIQAHVYLIPIWLTKDKQTLLMSVLKKVSSQQTKKSLSAMF